MNVRMARLAAIGARCLIAVLALLATIAFSYLLLHPEQRGDPPNSTTPSQPSTSQCPMATQLPGMRHTGHLI